MMLCYKNVRSFDEGFPEYNPDWMLRDINGTIISHVGATTFLKITDPLNQEYWAYLRDWFQTRQNEGYSGIYHDNGVTIEINTQWGYTGWPVNPRTPGQLYLESQYVADCTTLGNWLVTQFPNMYHAANGFWNGSLYLNEQPNFDYVIANSAMNCIMSEGMWGNMYGILYTETEWKRSLNFLRHLQDAWIGQGRDFMTYTNCRGAETRDQGSGVGIIGWERSAHFQFNSALLAVTRPQRNYLSMHRCMSEQLVQDYFKVDVGFPEEEYYELLGSGIYTRKWSKVQPFVNPGIITKMVNVAAMNLYDALGVPVSTVILKAKDGILLYQEPLTFSLLSYRSNPPGIAITVDGVPLQDGEQIEAPTGTVVVLKAEKKIEG